MTHGIASDRFWVWTLFKFFPNVWTLFQYFNISQTRSQRWLVLRRQILSRRLFTRLRGPRRGSRPSRLWRLRRTWMWGKTMGGEGGEELGPGGRAGGDRGGSGKGRGGRRRRRRRSWTTRRRRRRTGGGARTSEATKKTCSDLQHHKIIQLLSPLFWFSFILSPSPVFIKPQPCSPSLKKTNKWDLKLLPPSTPLQYISCQINSLSNICSIIFIWFFVVWNSPSNQGVKAFLPALREGRALRSSYAK